MDVCCASTRDPLFHKHSSYPRYNHILSLHSQRVSWSGFECLWPGWRWYRSRHANRLCIARLYPSRQLFVWSSAGRLCTCQQQSIEASLFVRHFSEFTHWWQLFWSQRRVLLRSGLTDVVVVAEDLNQYDCSAETERHEKGRRSIPVHLNAKGNRLIQICSDCRMFLANTDACVKKWFWLNGRSLLRLHSVKLRLITLPSVKCGVDQERTTDHSEPHKWTQTTLGSVLAFVCT